VRELSFRSTDGVLLFAWWFEAVPRRDGEPIPVILWAHGNAGNLTGRAQHAQALAGEGLSVFLFDYRGYGKSEGSPDESGIYADAEAAYAHLTGELGIPASRVVLMGRSLGSAPAARLAARVPHAATVLISPVPSARRMARRMFAGLPVDWLARSRFPVIEWVTQRSTPLLVVHGEEDQVVPLHFGREVFDAASEPKQFVLLPGAGHNDILAVAGRDYLVPLASFARSAVAALR
jgi:fermentation-respiration switch protein FrsA (DUF1100 family)